MLAAATAITSVVAAFFMVTMRRFRNWLSGIPLLSSVGQEWLAAMQSLRETRWLRLLVGSIVLVVTAAIIVQAFRSPLGANRNLADMVFGFLNDWAGILTAAVVLLVAFAALWTIRGGRTKREAEPQVEVRRAVVDWVERALRAMAERPHAGDAVSLGRWPREWGIPLQRDALRLAMEADRVGSRELGAAMRTAGKNLLQVNALLAMSGATVAEEDLDTALGHSLDSLAALGKAL